jgi:NitT/TauT family transport system permease protein
MFVAFNYFCRKTIYPMTVAVQLLPKIALAPLFITWFGFGYLPKIIIVFLLCFFPILLNGILGFLSITQELEWFAASTGAGKMRIFRKIRIQYALPQIFVGIRWAAVNATVGATIGEWIGGDAGLGYYIQIATGDLRMNLAFAIIVVLAALGMFLFKMVSMVESKMIPWHASQRRDKKGRFI